MQTTHPNFLPHQPCYLTASFFLEKKSIFLPEEEIWKGDKWKDLDETWVKAGERNQDHVRKWQLKQDANLTRKKIHTFPTIFLLKKWLPIHWDNSKRCFSSVFQSLYKLVLVDLYSTKEWSKSVFLSVFCRLPLHCHLELPQSSDHSLSWIMRPPLFGSG